MSSRLGWMVLEFHDWLGRILESVQKQPPDLAVAIIDVRYYRADPHGRQTHYVNSSVAHSSSPHRIRGFSVRFFLRSGNLHQTFYPFQKVGQMSPDYSLFEIFISPNSEPKIVDALALMLSSITSATKDLEARKQQLRIISDTLFRLLDLADEAPSLWRLLSHCVIVFDAIIMYVSEK
jgi:hypothetical protein